MKYNVEAIGKRILELRVKHKLTQKDLGKKLNVVGKQISNYESGKATPPIDVMFKLCEVFDCELGYLLGEPSYSKGSVFETQLYQDTGISPKAYKVLQRITGQSKESPHFGYKWEEYRVMLNQLILSPEFSLLINSLYDLHSAYKRSESFFSDIRNDVGEYQYEEGIKLWKEIEGLPDDEIPVLSNDQIDIVRRLSEAEDKSYSHDFVVKLMRYELNRAFETFVESLYPRGLNV